MNRAWIVSGYKPPYWPFGGGGGGGEGGTDPNAVHHADFAGVDVLPAGSTIEEIEGKVNNVITRLKGAVAAVLSFSFLVLTAAEVPPDVQLRKVNTTTTVREIVTPSAFDVLTNRDVGAVSSASVASNSVLWRVARIEEASNPVTAGGGILVDTNNTVSLDPVVTNVLWAAATDIVFRASSDATNYVDVATNDNWIATTALVRQAALDLTNYVDVATNDNWIATTAVVNRVALDATNYTDSVVKGIGSGAARPLPKYLHELSFDGTYPEDAAYYYEIHGGGPAACSSVRDGDVHSRNFDFPFDDRAEFVVRMSAGAGRFASVGVAQVGTNLTEDAVTSGKWSRFYKCLPGATVDGINERGVCVNINILSSRGHANGWHGDPDSDGIHCLAAVRWVLDNATSARHAAENLADRVYVPQRELDTGHSYHYMVSDAESTWIVEDGMYGSFTGRVAMTNVRSLDEDDPCGTGRERLALLQAGGSITDAWYTKAYTDTENKRLSEFVVTGDETEEELLAAWQTAHDLWIAGTRESHRGETAGGQTWWQTVHTSVYDLSAKTLRVCVQETDDAYVFSIPGFDVDEVREVADDEIKHYGKERYFEDSPLYPHANVFKWYLNKADLGESNPAELVWNANAEHRDMWSGNAFLSGLKIPVEMTTEWNGSHWEFHAVGHLPAALGGGDLVIPPFTGPSYKYEAPYPIGALDIWACTRSPLASTDDISAALEKIPPPSGGVDSNEVNRLIRDYRFPVDENMSESGFGIKAWESMMPGGQDRPDTIPWDSGCVWTLDLPSATVERFYQVTAHRSAEGAVGYHFSCRMTPKGSYADQMQVIVHCDGSEWSGEPARVFTNGVETVVNGVSAFYNLELSPVYSPIASEHYVDAAVRSAGGADLQAVTNVVTNAVASATNALDAVKRDKADNVFAAKSFSPWRFSSGDPHAELFLSMADGHGLIQRHSWDGEKWNFYVSDDTFGYRGSAAGTGGVNARTVFVDMALVGPGASGLPASMTNVHVTATRDEVASEGELFASTADMERRRTLSDYYVYNDLDGLNGYLRFGTWFAKDLDNYSGVGNEEALAVIDAAGQPQQVWVDDMGCMCNSLSDPSREWVFGDTVFRSMDWIEYDVNAPELFMFLMDDSGGSYLMWNYKRYMLREGTVRIEGDRIIRMSDLKEHIRSKVESLTETSTTADIVNALKSIYQ